MGIVWSNEMSRRVFIWLASGLLCLCGNLCIVSYLAVPKVVEPTAPIPGNGTEIARATTSSLQWARLEGFGYQITYAFDNPVKDTVAYYEQEGATCKIETNVFGEDKYYVCSAKAFPYGSYRVSIMTREQYVAVL